MARELADQKVTLILASTTLQVSAAKAATQSIPIVFNIGTDPVENGFVAKLGRTRDQFGGADANAVDVLRCEMHVELDVAAFDPAKFMKPLFERRPELSHLRIICVVKGQ